jgi:hypothetical protein
MNTHLVNGAKELGFESRMMSEKEWKHSSLESLRWLFWMTELQQWLRNNYDVKVFANYMRFGIEACNGYYYSVGTPTHYDSTRYSSYEECLEAGLLFIMNSLKVKNYVSAECGDKKDS